MPTRLINSWLKSTEDCNYKNISKTITPFFFYIKTYFQRLVISGKELVRLNLFLSKNSPKGLRLDKRCSRKFFKKEKRASLAILTAAAPTVCAVLLERSGVDMMFVLEREKRVEEK
jgi:hypothetical protein